MPNYSIPQWYLVPYAISALEVYRYQVPVLVELYRCHGYSVLGKYPDNYTRNGFHRSLPQGARLARRRALLGSRVRHVPAKRWDSAVPGMWVPNRLARASRTSSNDSASASPSPRNTHNEDDEDDSQKDEDILFSSALSTSPTSSISSPLAAQPVDWARLKQWNRLYEMLTPHAKLQGALIDARDSVGRTALHYAAGYGDLEALRALLRSGSIVDAADRFGVTPLHWACLKAHAVAVEELLAASADPLVQATAGVLSGRSALDLACSESHPAEVAEALTAALGVSLFEQRKVLGRGGFGTIIKAVRRDTGVAVALKAVRKPPGMGDIADRNGSGAGASVETSDVTVRGARAERDILSTVRHPFLVQLHSAFQT